MAAPTGGTPGTASVVQVPFGSHDDWVASELGAPATDAANAALATSCAQGAPIYRQHWYKYTAIATTTLRAEQSAVYQIGRDFFPIDSGVAILTAARKVIDCSTGPGTQAAKPTAVAAGDTVYVVGYVMNDGCSECISDYASDFSLQAVSAPPANDDWQNAAAITATPFSQTVDNRLATNQGAADEVELYFGCTSETAHSERTLWWTFTPAVTGPLTFSVSGPGDDRAALAFATAASGGPKFLPGVPDQCSNTPASFKAGTTYLVQVGLFRDDHDQGGGAGEGGPITLSVTGPSNALAKPDLVVTGITASPTSPRAGAPITFSARVKNQGGAATPNGTVLGVLFKVDGHAASWSDTFKTSLAPGGLVTLTANGGPAGVKTWSGPAGKHSLQAYVDDVNRIKGESNESNNTLTVPLTVAVGPMASLPDLVVTKVSWSPSSPAKGAPVRFSATVKNVGTGSTPNGTVLGVSFRINGVGTGSTYSDTHTSQLAPGAQVTLTANGGGSAGTWKPAASGATKVVVIVDDINRIPESTESNNGLQVTVTVK